MGRTEGGLLRVVCFLTHTTKPFSNVGKLLCLCVIITAAEWTGFYGNKPIIPPSAREREGGGEDEDEEERETKTKKSKTETEKAEMRRS